MQHGLAVEADDVDVFDGRCGAAQEGGDGLGMGDGDGPLGLAQDARPGIALRQVDGLGQRLAQQAALAVGIGPVAGRAERA